MTYVTAYIVYFGFNNVSITIVKDWPTYIKMLETQKYDGDYSEVRQILIWEV